MRMLRDARTMGLSAFFSLALAALRSILVLRLLGPEPSGVWKTVMVLYMTGEFLRLGVSKGMGVRVAVLAGQEREEEIARDVRAAGAYMWATGAVFALVLLGASFFAANADYAVALRFMAVIMLLAQPHQWLRELAAARQRFGLRGQELLLSGVVDFLCGIALSCLFGLPGIAMATVATIALPLGFLWRSQPEAWRVAWDWPRVRELMRAGIPLSLADSAFGLLRFVDLLVLSACLGSVAAGHYQVSLLVAEFAISIGNFAVSQVVGSHMLKEFGRSGCLKSAAAYYEEPLGLLSMFLPPVLAVGSVLVGPAVGVLLPQYGPGIPAAAITVWTTFFLCVHLSLGSFFQAAGKYRLVLGLFAVVVPMTALAHYLVVSNGLGLAAVAWTALIALVATVTAELWIARRQSAESNARILAFVMRLYGPVFLLMLATRWMEAYSWDLVWRLAAISLISGGLLWSSAPKLARLRAVRHAA
jgi:O-antigen/teichoic acid export membrane protein